MTDLKNIASIAAVVVASIGFFAAPTSAGATALTVGTGWQYDQASAQSIPSDGSPLTFTALSGAYAFSLVDGYIPGDEYTIVLNGVDIFSSTFGLTATPFVNNLGPYAATFAPEWTDTSFSRFEVWFGPGTYSFVVTDNSDVGYPPVLAIDSTRFLHLNPSRFRSSALALPARPQCVAARRRQRNDNRSNRA